ncbi:MAG TPA: 2-(1,2-epoxy-1,2-dihydrophenyl)acetyl-CoA isomerase PaaG [Gemmatimonadaceae bacterium]|nr:2-(1,2-epoxy-1,2-dihydrophenyl)acetyl-CoA isomerase PaaG [Gemmatimonadaceae bacterium]
MIYQHIVFAREQGVARITLNRPEVLNSINRAMASELLDALRAAAGDDGLRAVLLTGAGRAFCAGQDLAEAAPRPDGSLPDLGDFVRDGYNPIVRAVRTLEKPVVCAVNGVAAGAGANLALACDIVYASGNATFIQSFAKIGAIPDSGGTFLLPRIVGLQRASALAMLAEKIDADQARDWGMVYQVVEHALLDEVSLGAARQLAGQATRGLGLIKRAFNSSLGIDLDAQLDYEEELQREAGRTSDYAEGVRAFLEKRKPVFEGR